MSSLFPTLLIVAAFVYSVPTGHDYDIYEKSRLAIALGDRFLLSCRGALCDGQVHPNTWNSSVELDVEEIARGTGLEDFAIGGVIRGRPTYFVPRVVWDGEMKVIWFGVD